MAMAKSNLLKKFLVRAGTVTIACSILFTGIAPGTADAATYRNLSTSVLKSDNLSSAQKKRLKTIFIGRQYLGTPYEFGARYGQTRTFDCSSFTKYVFSKIGITLPRVTRDQVKKGTYVSWGNWKVGDLLFFTTPGRENKKGIQKIGHVGIYAGNDVMLHTYGKGGVMYDRVTSGYWKDKYITARRVIH